MQPENLERYLRDDCERGVIDHVLRATITPSGAVKFYVHPLGVDGNTLDFVVSGNTLAPDPDVTPIGDES